ncbi:MAG: small subunit ribosomal protein S4e [Halobacteriales archaeon]|jgi:small subunit ribosomal protein S4e
MTRHQKRLSVPDSWPVERKTATFTVKAGAGPHGEEGVPLLILLRDVLGYVDSKKEARYALNQDEILVNGKAISDEQRPIGMFDILAFTEREEYYRVFPDEGGRLALTPIEQEDAQSKLGKIVEKNQVAGGKTQLTLHDGQTLLVGDATSYSTKDSIVVGNDDTIVAHFPYEEGALVTATDGTHAGEVGELAEIKVTAGSSSNTVTVEQDDDAFKTVEEYVVVIDENFVEDEADVEETDEADDGEAVEEDESAESEETESESEDEDGGEAE